MRNEPKHRSWPATIVSAVVLLMTASGCVTDPVEEKIEITILPDDMARVGVTVSIAQVDPTRHPGAAERADSVSRQLLEETDAWSRRFAGLDKVSETRSWQKTNDELNQLRHSAVVELEELRGFLYDTPSSIFVSRDGSARVLTIYPGSGSRASREQTELLERRLEIWIGEVSLYYEALAALYEHLIANPERTGPVSAALRGEEATISVVEEGLVAELDRRLTTVIEALAIGTTESFSIQHLSKLVYDPLPAPIDIVIAEGVTESENFATGDGSGVYSIRSVGLLESLGSLRDHWITPDPLSTLLDSLLRGEAEDPGPETWEIRNPSIERVPSPAMIREALMAEMTRRRSYRLVWIADAITD